MFRPPFRHSMEGKVGSRDCPETARGSSRQQVRQTARAGAAGPAQSLVQSLEFLANGRGLAPAGRRSDRVARNVVERRPLAGRTKILSLVAERGAEPISLPFAAQDLPGPLCATAFADGR